MASTTMVDSTISKNFVDNTHVSTGEQLASPPVDVISQLGRSGIASARPAMNALPDLKVDEVLTQNAKQLVNSTQKALGSTNIRSLIKKNDEYNKPSVMCKQTVDLQKQFAIELKSSQIIPVQDEIDYAAIKKIDEALKEKIASNTQQGATSGIPTEFQMYAASSEVNHDNFCETYLKDIKDGDTIRILEPGNNDQTTPIILASQIKMIQDYLTKNEIKNVKVEVLVMGKGGHATTALFPQIGLMVSSKMADGSTKLDFTGVEEAESLTLTLQDALNQFGISSQASDLSTVVVNASGTGTKEISRFNENRADGFEVEIKKEKGSTNTGQNVAAAGTAWTESSADTRYFVAAATTANNRQVATFAQQFTKGYKEMVAIPMPRSPKVVDSFDDHTAVTEMYAGLAERCRSFLYMYPAAAGQAGFIPLSVIDQENLEDLYNVYADLSNMSEDETLKIQQKWGNDPKKVPLKEVMSFFCKQFTTMESSIHLNTSLEGNLMKTGNSVQRALNFFKSFEACKKMKNGQNLTRTVSSLRDSNKETA